jgi:hypothetical protein
MYDLTKIQTGDVIMWQEIKNRFNSDTPIFFKKIQKISTYVSTVCITGMALPGLPEQVSKVLSYGVAMGVVSIAISQLAVSNSEDTNKREVDKNIQ